jgi:hypothetical protein
MTNVKVFKTDGKWWYSYARPKLQPSQKRMHYFIHCACKTETYHCAFEYREDRPPEATKHQCFPNPSSLIPALMKKVEDTRKKQLENGRKPGKSYFDCSDDLSEVRKAWIVFQNRFHILFRAAVSKQFFAFGHALPRRGRLHPDKSEQELFPEMSAYAYQDVYHEYGTLLYELSLTTCVTETVCLSIDASKVAHTQRLIVYIGCAKLDHTVCYKLLENISIQEDYVNCAACLVEELKRKEITVGRFCTDGLGCQVNALSCFYKSFPFPFISITGHFLFLF